MMPGPAKPSAEAINAWRSEVSFSDGVPEKGEYCGVSGNPSVPLDDHCGPSFQGIRELPARSCP